MNRLKDKRALITGGTTGIGLETARHFLAEGARVAITGNNPPTLNAARAELGDNVVEFKSDAGDIAAQKTVAKAVGEASGQLDILCVNAGVVDMRPWTGGTKPASGVYCASKAALLSLARTLSVELIPRGIRVNAVSHCDSCLR
jgi:NAD(P)-dependent dehydrogenase (short-subunit alcohol dehydrogenase family)